MKKYCIGVTAFILCIVLAACGHTHNWLDASCEAPKTCEKCGATEGEALEHNWLDASCEAPKTCEKCGATEGEALGHNWLDASCEAPKTCNRCKATEGEPLAHNYGPWGPSHRSETGQWIRISSCAVCAAEQTKASVRTDLGSAGELKGTTLLISILADDAGTSWDLQSERDKETLALMDTHLKAGVNWLTEQVSAYGAEPRFLYDREAYPDLCYRFDFGEETLVRTDGGGYWTQNEYVAQYIPTGELMEKYQADNVIYIFFFNTDEQNTVNSWSLSDRSGVETEIINVFVRDDYYGDFYYMPAASFAHEIMHCFGAYDLYYPSQTIPQAYVDHCAATGSNDIMYTVGLGAEITQELTRLDAYYMGLIDTCEEVEIWGLGETSHTD